MPSQYFDRTGQRQTNQGGVDGSTPLTNHQQSANQSYPSTIMDEDDELKRKIVLYYHTLLQGSLSQWFVLLQQKNYKKLSKEQYIDLNVRIQKSLILDFDEASARESAD